MRLYQVLPLSVRVDLGVIAIKWYLAFPRSTNSMRQKVKADLTIGMSKRSETLKFVYFLEQCQHEFDSLDDSLDLLEVLPEEDDCQTQVLCKNYTLIFFFIFCD